MNGAKFSVGNRPICAQRFLRCKKKIFIFITILEKQFMYFFSFRKVTIYLVHMILTVIFVKHYLQNNQALISIIPSYFAKYILISNKKCQKDTRKNATINASKNILTKTAGFRKTTKFPKKNIFFKYSQNFSLI